MANGRCGDCLKWMTDKCPSETLKEGRRYGPCCDDYTGADCFEAKVNDGDIRVKMAAIVFHAAGRPLTEEENLQIVDLALSVSGPAKNKWDFITALCRRAYATSKAHGWKHDNPGQAIALMHSELSEALEAMRKPGCKDEHLPNLDPVGLELADVLIRVFDFCGARGIDLATCLKAKMDYNDLRPMKHGGKEF